MTSSKNPVLEKMPVHPAFRTGLTPASLKRCLIGFGIALVSVVGLAQQKAGEVTHLQGMATAQQPGGTYRFLGRGDAVLEGDVLSTTEKGFAVVSLADGSKFTLRPSTTFALDRFAHNQGTEATFMRLLKGGMRMVSGLVGKRNPAGVELRISTATIGIRGTSFDARICGEDCRQENQAAGAVAAQATAAAAASASAGQVVGRVVQSTGDVAATQPGKPARQLGVGAALYEGDDVRTGVSGVAVIGFRDQTKVSVNPQSALRIDTYVYNRPQTGDSMALSLLKGGLRVFTGLIGKKASTNFAVKTRTSTIGIRGTGMDISCEGPCVDQSLGEPDNAAAEPADPKQPDGLFMHTWEGGSYFVVGPLEVPLNQAGFVGRAANARLLASVPDFFSNFGSPRPDQVEVDWENLFGSVFPSGADGIYVLVRDGHVSLLSRSSRIDLGVDEGGYIGQNGLAQRLSPVPGFLVGDPYPIPELFSDSGKQIFQMFGVTLGQPGQEICRL